jgi:alpha-glucoside transport system permease protein
MRLLGSRIVQVFLAFVALMWLVPGIGLLITSIRPKNTFGESGWWTVFSRPSELTLENYATFLGDGQLMRSVWNTLLIAVPSTLLPVLLAAMAGYALAWIPFKGRDTLFLIIVAMLVVPMQMALIPAFQIFNFLKLTGIPAVWVFHTAFGLPFGIFLMRSFYAGLPSALLDAARIDGASEAKIFTRVVFPLGWPALVSLAIFQFTWTWNDLLVALVFAGQSQPFTVVIQQRLNEFGSGIGVIAPGVFIGAILPIAIFFSFQRYFEAGLLGGSAR